MNKEMTSQENIARRTELQNNPIPFNELKVSAKEIRALKKMQKAIIQFQVASIKIWKASRELSMETNYINMGDVLSGLSEDGVGTLEDSITRTGEYDMTAALVVENLPEIIAAIEANNIK